MATSDKDLEQEFIEKQNRLCDKYNSGYLASPFHNIIGIALQTFDKFEMPINGLRHPI